ncbi:hypothetical protein Hanom_Chr17g01529131 [Helianthus anomalus]
MQFSTLRFGQYCNFRSTVCFSAFESKRFEILPLLNPSIFSVKSGCFRLFC